MAITLDRTGLEISAGPFEFLLTGTVLGLVWEDRVDILLERRWERPEGAARFETWSQAPSWFEAALFGLHLSVQVGGARRSAVALAD